MRTGLMCIIQRVRIVVLFLFVDFIVLFTIFILIHFLKNDFID